jgi:hypothetical protein
MHSGFEALGSLFFTSNETQTAMDDFLLADLAWNTMESQFSSVETQMCRAAHSLQLLKVGSMLQQYLLLSYGFRTQSRDNSAGYGMY